MWPGMLDVENLIIVKTTLKHGEPIFGWFVEFDCTPGFLRRLPTHLVRVLARKFNRLTSTPREARVMQHFRDCVLVRPDVDFVTVADVRFYRQKVAMLREVKQARKRQRTYMEQRNVEEDLEDTGNTSEASRSSSVERESADCPICFEHGEHLMGFFCCKAGSCCESCSRKIRGLCSICDRELLNAAFRCAHCTAATRLKDYGYPCSDCGKNILCKACFLDWCECCDCDPLC